MPNAIYQITVREPRKGVFALFNEKSGEYAGPRFRKGSPKVRKGRSTVTLEWPFKGDGWMAHTTRDAAEKAAEKLQEYLDACEGTRSKAKQKDSSDRLEFSDTKNPNFD